MKIKYERIIKQVCEIELNKDEFENDATNVLDWGEETGEFDVLSEYYPELKLLHEVIEDESGLTFADILDKGYEILNGEIISLPDFVFETKLEDVSYEDFLVGDYDVDYDIDYDPFQDLMFVEIFVKSPSGYSYCLSREDLVNYLKLSNNIEEFQKLLDNIK